MPLVYFQYPVKSLTTRPEVTRVRRRSKGINSMRKRGNVTDRGVCREEGQERNDEIELCPVMESERCFSGTDAGTDIYILTSVSD